MQAREVLRSLTFRYIAKYVVVLSASVFVLLGAFYLYFSYTSFRDLGAGVLEELQTLRSVYQRQTMIGVEQYIDDRAKIPAVHRYSYLISNAQGDKVAGDLPAAPRYSEFDDGWLGFELALQDWDGSIDVDFLARPIDLGDGYEAIVARSYADIVERAQLVFSNLFRAMFATVLLGLIGGYFGAASALHRVERLNRQLSLIIRGDPSKRLQPEGEKGYVRALAEIMNQMLEQMESLMQGVRRVSDNIAHDLRTPLTHLRNKLSDLQRGQSAEVRGQLDQVIDDCDSLLVSFNASLRISTLESGKRLAVASKVEMKALLHDVVELYEPLAQERGISLQFVAQEPLYCTGEADLLFQLFANLLDNAVKYTPDSGAIEVHLRALSGGDLSVFVADSGPGIPLAERKNVFRRFYRVEASRGEFPGHGLGLSLVQAIAQYHRGSVELASNNPGLQVRVRLPGGE